MKKIENFKKLCCKINLPIDEIKIIEKSVKARGGTIFIVGGAVRDLITGKNNKNKADLVVNLNIKQLIDCLKKSKLKFINIGIKYGSIVVMVNKIKIDLTIMRSDIKTDGRWAEIQFTSDINEDSARRDFTFNSIYCDTNGNIYDPYDGINDLKKGNVKFIGDVKKRIEEDYLRILRYFRFSVFYSKTTNNKILKILGKYSLKLKDLSFERKFDEIIKILSYDNIHKFIKKKLFFQEFKRLLEISLDTRLDFNNFYKFCELEMNFDYADPYRRIKFLIRNSENPNFFDKIETDLKTRLAKVFKNYQGTANDLNELFYFNKKSFLKDFFIISCADDEINKTDLEEKLEALKNFKNKIFPLNGNDLIEIGFKPSKLMGEVLKKTEIWWVKNYFKKNKKNCLTFASKYLP